MAPIELQLKWLESQIQLGIELDLPLFFHERGAHDEFLNMVRKYEHQLRGKSARYFFF